MREMSDMWTEDQEEEINLGGRPKAEIDWNKVAELLIAGCTGTEIAGYFGIKPPTLYDRCKTDNNKLFSEFSQEKQAKGDSLLRAHQYAKALGLTDKGDNTLLIWLGKTRLKQKEEQDQIVPKEIESKFDALMEVMKKSQDLSASEISISEHIKS